MRVLIVSNHSLIGQSLVAMLRNLPPEESLEASLCDSGAAVEQTRSGATEVVLVEAVADFASGIATVRALAEAVPAARMVVLGAGEDEASVYEAIYAGAHGYLPSETSPAALSATLRGVVQGELGLTRSAALRLVQQLCRALRTQRPRVSQEVLGKLTAREQEILALMRQGIRSREMAERLYIADATVYKHIQNILDKLHVHTRTQAILMAEMEENGNGKLPTKTPGMPRKTSYAAARASSSAGRRSARP
jgi:two-component system NarL family response regulator